MSEDRTVPTARRARRWVRRGLIALGALALGAWLAWPWFLWSATAVLVRDALAARDVRLGRVNLLAGAGWSATDVRIVWGPALEHLALRAATAEARLDRWPGRAAPAHLALLTAQGFGGHLPGTPGGLPATEVRMRTLRLTDLRVAEIEGLEVEFPRGGPAGLRGLTAARATLTARGGVYHTAATEADAVTVNAQGVRLDFGADGAFGAIPLTLRSFGAELAVRTWQRPAPEWWAALAEEVRSVAPAATAAAAGGSEGPGVLPGVGRLGGLEIARVEWRRAREGVPARVDTRGVRATVRLSAAGGEGAWRWVDTCAADAQDVTLDVEDAGGTPLGRAYVEELAPDGAGRVVGTGATWEANAAAAGVLRGVACRRVEAQRAPADAGGPAFAQVTVTGAGVTLAFLPAAGPPSEPFGQRAQAAARLAERWEIREALVTLRVTSAAGRRSEFQIEDLHADATTTAAGIEVGDFAGRLAEGRLHLAGRVGLAAGAGSDLAVDLAAAGLERLAAGTALADRRLAGKLHGNARLTHDGSAEGAWVGGGRLSVTSGAVQGIPVLSSFVTAVKGMKGKEAKLSEGHVDFTLLRDRIEYADVLVQGPVLAGCGSGHSRRDGTELELHLVPRVGGETTVIPILGTLTQKILDTVKGQLMEVEVTGSVSEPASRVVPLKLLTAPVRRFLGGGGKEAKREGEAPAEGTGREERRR